MNANAPIMVATISRVGITGDGPLDGFVVVGAVGVASRVFEGTIVLTTVIEGVTTNAHGTTVILIAH